MYISYTADQKKGSRLLKNVQNCKKFLGLGDNLWNDVQNLFILLHFSKHFSG